jgi:hypothetical protein
MGARGLHCIIPPKMHCMYFTCDHRPAGKEGSWVGASQAWCPTHCAGNRSHCPASFLVKGQIVLLRGAHQLNERADPLGSSFLRPSCRDSYTAQLGENKKKKEQRKPMDRQKNTTRRKPSPTVANMQITAHNWDKAILQLSACTNEVKEAPENRSAGYE